VTDQHTKINFLVNTGVDLCVYPRSRLRECRTQTSYDLPAANGIIVQTHGCVTQRLDLGLRRMFSFRFVIANVTGLIKGLDFLRFYNLLLDI